MPRICRFCIINNLLFREHDQLISYQNPWIKNELYHKLQMWMKLLGLYSNCCGLCKSKLSLYYCKKQVFPLQPSQPKSLSGGCSNRIHSNPEYTWHMRLDYLHNFHQFCIFAYQIAETIMDKPNEQWTNSVAL